MRATSTTIGAVALAPADFAVVRCWIQPMALTVMKYSAARFGMVAIQRPAALERTVTAGKAACVLAYDVEDARSWLEAGCTFLVYSQPEIVLSNHYRDVLTQLKDRRSTA